MHHRRQRDALGRIEIRPQRKSAIAWLESVANGPPLNHGVLALPEFRVVDLSNLDNQAPKRRHAWPEDRMDRGGCFAWYCRSAWITPQGQIIWFSPLPISEPPFLPPPNGRP